MTVFVQLPFKLSPMITILDFEASGLEAESYPIQVAWNNGEEIHSYYINPETANGWLWWSEASEGVHGIPRDYLIKHGRPVEEVAAIMHRELAGKVIFSDAVEYDSWWCNRLFDESTYEVNFQWGDFWHRVTREKPPTIHGLGSFEAGQWRQGLWEEVMGSIGLRTHLADNDVRIRMEIFRLAEQRNRKWDY